MILKLFGLKPRKRYKGEWPGGGDYLYQSAKIDAQFYLCMAIVIIAFVVITLILLFI